MRTQAQWALYKELELIAEPIAEATSHSPLLQSWLSNLWDLLTGDPEEFALEIEVMRDRSGNRWWFVYDPVSGDSAKLSSEHELLHWVSELERRRLEVLYHE